MVINGGEFKIRLRRPHHRQVEFVESIAPRIIIRAGRRSGKTIGAAIVALKAWLAGRRVLYAAPTTDQVRTFWFEVKHATRMLIDAGLVSTNETEHIIEFPNSVCRIRAKSAWNADTLRGDYCDLLIIDEWQLCSEDMWETVGAPMLLDNNGDALFIYTPPSLHSRSVSKARDPRHAAKMFAAAQADRTGRWQAFSFTSHDNPHISAQALADITRDMTQLAYKQEILAEDITEVPGALWKQMMIDLHRIERDKLPQLESIVVGVDPPGSATTECGIVMAGRGRPPLNQSDDGSKHIYVLADRSMLAPTAKAWAQAAVNLYFEWKADRLIGERNYGGDMVEGTIRQVEGGQAVSYLDANATRGKIVRAQPLAAAYERGLVHHVGEFPELEEEMLTYVEGNKSPNRLDACWIAGTMIRTDKGELAIESIEPGMSVLTRAGYREVLWSGSTGHHEVISKRFPNGRILTGTPQHRIFTANRGFRAMDSLLWYDMIRICIEKPLFFKGSNTIGILTVPAGISGFISLAAWAARRFSFIVKSIGRNMGRFQKGIMSIIRMANLSIMKYSIWSLFRQPNTMQNFADSAGIIWPGLDHSLALGTQAPKGEHGIRSMAAKAGLEENQCSSVPRRARKSAHGIFAETFNLQVQGDPEYFANGILVHNCVWCGLHLLEGSRVVRAVPTLFEGESYWTRLRG